ncbi:MAG: helicase-related protein [Chthoniobacterales bacterium]|nr:helicase-related protein [Chthoniobacterales bacterium]
MQQTITTKNSDLKKLVNDFFCKNGILSRDYGFDFRPQQLELASMVAEAIENYRIFAGEAGTGTGKTLAYLFPSIVSSNLFGRKAIISTHTINLQKQIIDKEIPILKNHFGFNFEATVLQGQNNYLCFSRLKNALNQQTNLFNSNELYELKQIETWAQKQLASAGYGTKSEIDFQINTDLWTEVCCEKNFCKQNNCSKHSLCFYHKAKNSAQKANIVVVNHSLFFNLLKNNELINNSDIIIFDEAHTLETVAQNQLGTTISEFALRKNLLRLYNPQKKSGILKAFPNSCKIVAKVLEICDKFFTILDNKFCSVEKKEFLLEQNSSFEHKNSTEYENLIKALSSLVDHILSIQTSQSLIFELKLIAEEILNYLDELKKFFNFAFPDYVYWIEKTKTPNNQNTQESFLQLKAVPLDIAEFLKENLFTKNASFILTSATLTTLNNDFSYFLKKLGLVTKHNSLQKDIITKKFDSPFDFNKQMTIYIDITIPEPDNKNYTTYIDILSDKIFSYCLQTNGHALVLFTNYKYLNCSVKKLKEQFLQNGLNLLYQNHSESRSQLIHRFKTEKNSVLFGTDSFWTGVDIPGKALQNVIITRLPFPVPDHPLIQAKFQKIKNDNGDPFNELSLMEALIKFRQGVGRLIRSKDDKGILVILDSRIINKPYSNSFLQTLPTQKYKIISPLL